MGYDWCRTYDSKLKYNENLCENKILHRQMDNAEYTLTRQKPN